MKPSKEQTKNFTSKLQETNKKLKLYLFTSLQSKHKKSTLKSVFTFNKINMVRVKSKKGLSPTDQYIFCNPANYFGTNTIFPSSSPSFKASIKQSNEIAFNPLPHCNSLSQNSEISLSENNAYILGDTYSNYNNMHC